MAYTVDMDPGKQLFSQGDIGDEMYVVLDGSISIFLEKDAIRTDLERLEKGEELNRTFGWPADDARRFNPPSPRDLEQGI